MKRNLLLVLAFALSVATAAAQQFWDKKPYDDWSKDDCKRMLTNSPWVQKWDYAEVVFAPVNRQTDMGTEANRQINYLAQFRSALPVRRAVVRAAYLGAIQGKQVTPEQTADLRRQSEVFLATSFSGYVVLHLTYGSNIQEVDRALARYWQQQTTDTVKNLFYLIGSNGKRLAPVRYEVMPGAGREFEVTFPRMVDGAPIVSQADKSIALEFTHPAIEDPQSQTTAQSRHVLMQFKLKDMVSEGKLVY